MKYQFLILVLAALPAVLYAQEKDWEIDAEFRIRSEVDGRDFLMRTYAPVYTLMRTRVGVLKEIDNLSFYAQAQDSRQFGEEYDSRRAIDNLDIHQAYIKVENPLALPFEFQAGRFEMSYANERLISINDWHNAGRAFDGARLRFSFPSQLDLFAAAIRSNIYSRGNTSSYSNPQDQSHLLFGAWFSLSLAGNRCFDLFSYYEINNTENNNAGSKLSRITSGAYYKGEHGGFTIEGEAAYQWGKDSEIDISAYLAGTQLQYQTGAFKFGAGAVFFSGTAPGISEMNSFDNNLGRGHSYLGFMDYFSSEVVVQSMGLGLRDYYTMIQYCITGSGIETGLYLHYQTSAEEGAGGQSLFGQEVDLVIKLPVSKEFLVSLGASVYNPDELMVTRFKTNNLIRDDIAFWSYVQLSAAF